MVDYNLIMHADVIKRLNAHVARDIARGGVGGGGGGGPDTTDPPPAALTERCIN